MGNNFTTVEKFFNSRAKYGIKPGLDRMKSLLQGVGNPENSLKTIHVTGTNGKGSTIAFLNNSLIANGYKVGVFSSPSMTGLCGHMKINEKQITEKEFSYYLNELMPYINRLDGENNHPSEFEIVTVIAFLYFQNEIDIALIETGMGGKGDTTNVITPLLSIITSISIDHTQFLGESLEQITEEKAGIIKKDTPILIGHLEDISKKIVMDTSYELNAKFYSLKRDFIYKTINDHTFTYKDFRQTFRVQLNMKGEHQIHNAVLALKAVRILERARYSINWDKTLRALKNTTVPGRFEIINNYPKIILDGAHNESSMESLIKTAKSQYAIKDMQLIFAAFKDKSLNKLVPLIENKFTTITVTTFDHPRATEINELTKYFNRSIQVNKNWEKLIDQLLKEQEDKIFIITGSLHFIFLVRNYIIKKQSNFLTKK